MSNPKYRNITISKKGIINGEEWHESMMGGEGFWCKFSGCTSLMKIHYAYSNADNKTVMSICMEAGYPEMAMYGDWSGIRDSEPAQIKVMEKISEAWYKKKHSFQVWPWQNPAFMKA